MVKVFRYGLMDLFMKVTGKITNQMEEEDLFILMVIFMKESGWMIKLMVKAN